MEKILRVHHVNDYARYIGASKIEQVLELVARYYALQLSTSATSTNSDLLPRFEHLLRKYYDDGMQRQQGLPTVKYCARDFTTTRRVHSRTDPIVHLEV